MVVRSASLTFKLSMSRPVSLQFAFPSLVVKTDSGADYNNASFTVYLACLVKSGYCREVQFIHQVSGHTKDINDQNFGIMTLYVRQHAAHTIDEYMDLCRDAFPKSNVKVEVLFDAVDYKHVFRAAPKGPGYCYPLLREGKRKIVPKYADFVAVCCAPVTVLLTALLMFHRGAHMKRIYLHGQDSNIYLQFKRFISGPEVPWEGGSPGKIISQHSKICGAYASPFRHFTVARGSTLAPVPLAAARTELRVQDGADTRYDAQVAGTYRGF